MSAVGQERARRRFEELVARPRIPLAEAALAIAEEEYPGLDPSPYLRKLESMAAKVRERAPGEARATAMIPALRAVLFGEGGFRGNDQDYYDPRNSFLNEVMDRRLGIPISLSLIYIEVAWRVGFKVEGVSFPGHFLVRYDGGTPRALFIDPYNGGEILSPEQCEERWRAVTHGRGGEFDPHVLEAVGPRQMLARMLHNLKKIYIERRDDVRSLWVIDRLLILDPASSEEKRDRGLVTARLGGHQAALRDLTSYLDDNPGADDADEVEQVILALKSQTHYLN